MRTKFLLAGASLLVLVGAAHADTITGTWSGTTVSSATSPHTTLFLDSGTPASGSFSVSTTPITGVTNHGDLPEAQFITVNPGSCTGSGCNAATANVSVTFGQIKDGSTVLSNGFTLYGVFSADYLSNPQTDALVWTSASIADTSFLPGGVPGVTFINNQDGDAPGGLDFAFADGSNIVNLFILDGADWSVVTNISANVVGSNPDSRRYLAIRQWLGTCRCYGST